MKRGHLSQYFEAVAAKRLTAVEADPKNSNQHEFNGTVALKKMLGTYETGETTNFNSRFIYMGEKDETVTSDGTLSWYDSRFEKPRASEWRLYFKTTDVSELAKPGDLLILGKQTDGTILTIVAAAGSTAENQLLWLFDVPVQEGNSFIYHGFLEQDKEVDFASRFILDELGIEIEETEAAQLDSLITEFDGIFPTTKKFSEFARKTVKNVDPVNDPDRTLMAWMEQEEKLFRRLERKIVEQRLRGGFIDGNNTTDVDGFISFSLSVQNRRKSRAGFALENHLEELLKLHGIPFTRNGKTENKANPDFLFPGELEYQTKEYPDVMLSMLGVKTTCKDRWRQVLSEAARIRLKHLLTLEPGISEAQTIEMKAQHLQLVVPTSIHATYSADQRKWLLSVKEFIKLMKDKQGLD
jgi:hypothetical protein